MALSSVNRARRNQADADIQSLRESLSYNPDTGVFTWVKRPRGATRDVAGKTTERGYRRITLKGRSYYAHRLAWLFMTGEWPENEVDHIDRDPSNNKWSNLRAATHRENGRNGSGRHFNPKSKFRGVEALPKGRWRAAITLDNRKQHIGCFASEVEAAMAYDDAASAAFGAFACLNFPHPTEVAA